MVFQYQIQTYRMKQKMEIPIYKKTGTMIKELITKDIEFKEKIKTGIYLTFCPLLTYWNFI